MTTVAQIANRWGLVIGLSWLVAGIAQAGPLFDEIDIGVTDHRGHDHSDESNSDVLGAGIDATCLTPGPTPSGCTTFRRSEFFDSDFTGADFTDANLSLTEITSSIFGLSTLVGADFDDAYIERSDFDDADLTNVTMRRATLRAGSFDRADFTDAILTDAQLRCIADPDDDDASLCPSFEETQFTGTTLTSALFAQTFGDDELAFSATDFTDADLTDAVLSNMVDPCLQIDEDTNTWSCLTFANGASPSTTIDGLSITGASDLRGSDWQGLTITDSFMQQALIAGAQFDATTIVDSDFQLANAQCRVEDTNAEDDLCDFFDANGFETADFNNATISGTTFANADLRASDFTDADLSDVVFDSAWLGCASDPEGTDDCSNCAILEGALDGQVALPDDEYNISMQSIDWRRIIPCSQIVFDDTGTPLIDDLSHIQLDGGSFRETDVTAVDFAGSSLASMNFREATISAVVFDGANLSGANLTDAKTPCTTADGCASFEGANLTSATLSGIDFTGAASGANFDNAVLDGAVAVETDFSGASFEGDETSAIGAIFSSSVLDNATFSEADLTGMRAVCLTANDETVCASFRNVAFSDSDLTGVDLRGADLSGTTYAGSDLTGASFAEATIDTATLLAGAQIDGLDLSDVDLSLASPSLFQGLAAFTPDDDEEPQGVDLADADLDSFDLSGLDLSNWTFDDSSLEGVDFSGATLTGASFENIQFDEIFSGLTIDTDFFAGAILKNADLRGLDLTGYDLSDADLTGATVRSTQFDGIDLTGAKLVNLQKICDDGENCADFAGAMLSCADLSDTNFANFAAGGTDKAGTALFQSTDPDLSGIVLDGADLYDYDFTDADLTHAELTAGDLRLADFTDATLSGASFAGSTVCQTSDPADCPDFTGADIAGAGDCDDLQGVDFSGIDFSNAPDAPDTLFNAVAGDDATCANFTNANLGHPDAATTTGFDFSDITTYTNAVIAGAQLRYQTLTLAALGPNFFQQFAHAPEFPDDPCVTEDEDLAEIDTSPDLSETIFDCAELDGQNLGGADLREADLIQTNLDDVSFTGSEMKSTDFTNVVFDDDDLETVFLDIATLKQDPEDPDSDEVVDEDDVPYPNLQYVNFAYADLQAATPVSLNHVDLSYATLDGAKLMNTDLRDAIFDNAVSLCGSTPTTLCEDDLEGVATEFEECVNIDGASVEGASFRLVSFKELFNHDDPDDPDATNFFQNVAADSLQGVNFFGAHIVGLDFTDLDLTDGAIFQNTTLCENNECAILAGVTFGSSDSDDPILMTSIDFRKASIAGATFTNIDLTGADLRDVGNLCDEVVTTDCVEFSGANTSLQSVEFRDLDFTGVSFGSGADAVENFTNADFRRADLSGVDGGMLEGRDFTGARFFAANLSGIDFENSILADSESGCRDVDGDEVCTNFDAASLCGVDARGATFEGSFDGTSTWPAGCATTANLAGALFTDSKLATLDLSFANLEGARFDSSLDFCNDDGDCLAIDGANLIGVDFHKNDFGELPADWFQAASIRDLSEANFSEADLSGKALSFTDFSYADLSQADLRDADLRNAVFDQTQFAEGASTDNGRCTLASGGGRVDLRGADLSGADFSRAKNFHRGCIRVDASTTFDARTRLPTGFDLLANMTMIPEPQIGLLRATALLAIGWLANRRRRSSR